MFTWLKKVPISNLNRTLSRPEILKRGRVLIIDDDVPEMLEDLRRRGLTIDHISSTDDARFTLLENGHYDVLLLDYGGVGARFGADEGLDVLKHVKRVNPAVRVLAFTGRTFDASKADFFRFCDGVIKKDSGIQDLLVTIESHLEKVLTPSHHWDALKKALDGKLNANEISKLETILSDAIAKKDVEKRSRYVDKAKLLIRAAGLVSGEALITKLVELGIDAVGDLV